MKIFVKKYIKRFLKKKENGEKIGKMSKLVKGKPGGIVEWTFSRKY